MCTFLQHVQTFCCDSPTKSLLLIPTNHITTQASHPVLAFKLQHSTFKCEGNYFIITIYLCSFFLLFIMCRVWNKSLTVPGYRVIFVFAYCASLTSLHWIEEGGYYCDVIHRSKEASAYLYFSISAMKSFYTCCLGDDLL